jgi:hypothetical protein
MHNLGLREQMAKARVHSYEVAAALGVSECYFSRKMSREELSSDEYTRVERAIMRLMDKEG